MRAVRPRIEGTEFGSITVAGSTHECDVVIGLDGSVAKRKKKLSSRIYGTSHTISLAEAEHVHQPGAARVILGTGQFGLVRLSDEATLFLSRRGCDVLALPTPAAVEAWNRAAAADATVGLFHVTC